ncbi:MAG: NAD(P)-dependent alcohol dehydrogenase [Alphaproteobacteria bacterium]|nr:NAD(P)-dependent alcohol dehydrogenase [Alphaproteobacteria bacterium]
MNVTHAPLMNAAYTPAYGPPSVLELRRLPVPTPGPREVLVQVEASAVTAGDLRVRAGDFGAALRVLGRLLLGWSGPRRPVQGNMFAGVVTQVGAQVERFAVGDAVFGSSSAGGAWAESLCVSEDGALALRPPTVRPAEAAAAPYGAGTAAYFLEELAQVQAGERVLVLGGAGGVGVFAVQLARHLGAHVTAVGSAETLALMRELGAHEVLDYRRTDFATLGLTWDVILDTADASSFTHSRPALSARGRYLTLYAGLGVMAQMLRTRGRPGPRALFGVASGSRARTERLAQLLAEGALRPVIAAEFPIARVADAHRRAEHGGPGAVLLRPGLSALAALESA